MYNFTEMVIQENGILPAASRAALSVLSWCEKNEANVKWMTGTIDGTVLLEVECKQGKIYKLEIEDKNTIGVACFNRKGDNTFLSVTINTLDSLLSN